MNLSKKYSVGGERSRGLRLWTAVAFALVPILVVAFSSYRNGVLGFDLGDRVVRSMPFMEVSIFAIGLYIFIRWFRQEALLKCMVWTLVFLVSVICGAGCVKFSMSADGRQSYFLLTGIVVMDFFAAIAFGVAFHLIRRMMHRK